MHAFPRPCLVALLPRWRRPYTAMRLAERVDFPRGVWYLTCSGGLSKRKCRGNISGISIDAAAECEKKIIEDANFTSFTKRAARSSPVFDGPSEIEDRSRVGDAEEINGLVESAALREESTSTTSNQPPQKQN